MKFVWMFLGFLCLSAIVLAAPVDQDDDVTVSDQEWENFKKEYGKNYTTKEEEAKRRANYAKNMKENSQGFQDEPELNDPKIKKHLDLDAEEFRKVAFNVMIDKAAAKAFKKIEESFSFPF